jgi:hypothetical protein
MPVWVYKAILRDIRSNMDFSLVSKQINMEIIIIKCYTGHETDKWDFMLNKNL